MKQEVKEILVYWRGENLWFQQGPRGLIKVLLKCKYLFAQFHTINDFLTPFSMNDSFISIVDVERWKEQFTETNPYYPQQMSY